MTACRLKSTAPAKGVSVVLLLAMVALHLSSTTTSVTTHSRRLEVMGFGSAQSTHSALYTNQAERLPADLAFSNPLF